MVVRGVDRQVVAAEARLERLDDGEVPSRSDDRGQGVALDLDHADRDGLHIEEEEPAAYDVGSDDEPLAHEDGETDALVEAFCEAFNARDIDGLVDLLAEDCETPGLGNDCANFPEAVEHLWERRPSSALTRGDLDGRTVAVLWEVGDAGGWWAIAPILFDDPTDGLLGLVELVEDHDTLAAVEATPPEDEYDEGTRWEEWDEGVDG